jgi:hypothetical protein
MNINIYRLFTFTLALMYWVFCTHYHVVITEILTDWFVTPYGRFLPREYVLEFSVFLILLLLSFIVIKYFTGTRKLISTLYWLFIFLMVILSYLFLITVPIEIIHFPQYAVLALLFAISLDRKKSRFLVIRILLIVTFLGIIDEAYQYLYLTAKSSHYLDFNDFFLNQIGTSIGILIYYGFTKQPVHLNNIYQINISIKKVIISLILLTALFSFLSNSVYFRTADEINPGGFSYKDGKTVFYLERIPGKFGNWEENDKGTGYFYILDPIFGIMLMILFSISFGTLDRRILNTKIKLQIESIEPNNNEKGDKLEHV